MKQLTQHALHAVNTESASPPQAIVLLTGLTCSGKSSLAAALARSEQGTASYSFGEFQREFFSAGSTPAANIHKQYGLLATYWGLIGAFLWQVAVEVSGKQSAILVLDGAYDEQFVWAARSIFSGATETIIVHCHADDELRRDRHRNRMEIPTKEADKHFNDLDAIKHAVGLGQVSRIAHTAIATDRLSPEQCAQQLIDQYFIAERNDD